MTAILITRAVRGTGRAMRQVARKRGWDVTGTARDAGAAKALEAEFGAPIR